MIASFGMSGYRPFEAGKNGVFIVLPSGRPNCWKHYRWYTPTKGDGTYYGNWSFLKDGATPGNGAIENWFELLEEWNVLPTTLEIPVEEARLQGWLWRHGPWVLGAMLVVGIVWLAIRKTSRRGRTTG